MGPVFGGDDLRPRIGDFALNTARSLLRTGLLFFVLQIAGLLAYQLDNFIIAQIMGAAAVQQYAIPMSVFARTTARQFWIDADLASL